MFQIDLSLLFFSGYKIPRQPSVIVSIAIVNLCCSCGNKVRATIATAEELVKPEQTRLLLVLSRSKSLRYKYRWLARGGGCDSGHPSDLYIEVGIHVNLISPQRQLWVWP